MINLMLCYARSGGTLLNKCLGSLPNIIMLSEVNPMGGGYGPKKAKSPVTVKDQAQEYYGINLQSNDYGKALQELDQVCSSMEKHLIVRDWPFVNYHPFQRNDFQPANELLALEEICNYSKPRTFAFVRNSIDVWISRGMSPLDEFFEPYGRYVEAILQLDLPIFHYEDFVNEPKKELRRICEFLEIPFSESALTDFSSYDKAHGDTQLRGGSRGEVANSIARLPRKIIPRQRIREIQGCAAMKEINDRLGYPPCYFRSMADRGHYAYRRLKTRSASLLSRK